MTILAYLATGSGIITSFFMIPKVYRIFKRKSAKDISIITFALIFLTGIIWIFYGIELGDIPLITTSALGVLFVGLINIGWLLYGREKK